MKIQKWYFTFGASQPNDGCYVVFSGTQMEARKKMFKAFGSRWSFQYSEEQWRNPALDTILFKGLDPKSKPTMAEVWGWKEIKRT